MNTHSAQEVKTYVANYLKTKGYTQADVGERLALGRQTISNILSNHDEYFTEKHAVLFSLGYGFRKQYLMNGEGTPINTALLSYIPDETSALDISIELLRESNQLAMRCFQLLIGKEQLSPLDKDLLTKLTTLFSFMTTFLYTPAMIDKYTLFDLTLAQSAEELTRPLRRELNNELNKE